MDVLAHGPERGVVDGLDERERGAALGDVPQYEPLSGRLWLQGGAFDLSRDIPAGSGRWSDVAPRGPGTSPLT